MKKLISLVLALVMVMCMVAVAEEEVAPMTYEQYCAAELEEAVVVKAYVQGGAYNATYGNICLYLADDDGAYYVYRAACDDALAEQIWEGAPVLVKGFKSAWAGEVEIIDATIEVLDEDGAVYEAIDVTEFMASEELIDYMNALVAVNGAVVVAYNEAGDAFSYAWDGSGAAGANSDLYFNVQVGETVYTMTVESDECAEGTEVYTAVTELKVGDVIDLTGFLYWYNGANIHVNCVVVK